MDVTGILYQGIKVIRDRENLVSFFTRGFRKAERDSFYKADDFFNPLSQRVEILKNKLAADFVSKKKQLEAIIERASKNEYEFWDHYDRNLLDKRRVNYDNFKEEQNKLWFWGSKQNLADLDISKTQTRFLHEIVSYADIGLLEEGIGKARESVVSLLNDKYERRKLTIVERSTESLKAIWLAEAKISVEEFIQKGVEIGLWDERLKLIPQKGKSPYGSGKTLLANIFIALKGYSIHSHTDHKLAGELFCKVFAIENKKTTKQPYKVFSSASPKGIKEIKRAFKIQ